MTTTCPMCGYSNTDTDKPDTSTPKKNRLLSPKTRLVLFSIYWFASVLTLTGIIAATILPATDSAIEDYADGPDDIAGNTDDPPRATVTLIHLIPRTTIACIAVGGISYLITYHRNIHSPNDDRSDES